jgi:hypothetical protein
MTHDGVGGTGLQYSGNTSGFTVASFLCANATGLDVTGIRQYWQLHRRHPDQYHRYLDVYRTRQEDLVELGSRLHGQRRPLRDCDSFCGTLWLQRAGHHQHHRLGWQARCDDYLALGAQ